MNCSLQYVLNAKVQNIICSFYMIPNLILLALRESGVYCTNVRESGADGEHQGATNEFQLISVGRYEA